MKKSFILSSLLLIAVAAMAQQPVITFQKTEHDFGKINEGDGRVSTIFEFKNEGMEPLVLSNVRASCGCTTPTWTRTPVEPGETGTITVTYNPNGRPGRFQKTVTITSNASNPTVKVYIKGEVLPKQAQPKNEYTVKMGELSLKDKTLDYGTILKGANLTRSIEYANQTEQDIKVEVLVNDKDNFLIPVLSLENIKPGEAGTLNVNFDAAVCKEYGPVNRKIYIAVNGERKLTDEFKIDVKANVAEDFTNVDLATAPIVEADYQIDLGTVKSGQKISGKGSLKNVGVNPLYIRRVILPDDLVNLSVKNSTVKSGKTTTMNATASTIQKDGTPLVAGVYRRVVRILTNDPKKSNINITVSWTIE